MSRHDENVTLHVSIRDQRLTFSEANGATRSYCVSTACNGSGNRAGSGCTPLGFHRMRVKIGAGGHRGRCSSDGARLAKSSVPPKTRASRIATGCSCA